MTTSQKIAGLRKKMTSRQKQLTEINSKISKEKAKEKALKKEIDRIAEEISQFEIKELSDTLTASGITAADVQNAITSGLIRPSEKSENTNAEKPTNDTDNKADAVTDTKEVADNEISDS